MSAVFTCSCGRKTTEPFIISGERYCTVCAEDLRPDIVASRERHNLSKFGGRRGFSSGFERQRYDVGKHR